MLDRTIFVDGLKSHYILLGDRKNPPLLLVHSFHNNAQTTLPIGKALSRKFRVILPDLPGFGESQPFTKHQFSIEKAAEFLPKLLSVLRIEKCFIMGISMGGAIATCMIADNPKISRGLILLHPLHTGSHISFPHRNKIEKLLILSRFPLTTRLASFLWSNKFVVSFILKKIYANTSKEYLSWRLQCLQTCTPATYLAALSSILHYSPSYTGSLNMRTILIYNPKDNLINPQKMLVGFRSVFTKLTVLKSTFKSHNPTPTEVMHYLEKNQTLVSQHTSSL